MVKLLINMVSDAIAKKYNLDGVYDKLDKISKQIEQTRKNTTKFGKYVEELEKDIANLKAVLTKNKVEEKTEFWKKTQKELKKKVKGLK